MQISTTQDFAKVVANSNLSIDERELLRTGLFACNEYLDPVNHSVFSMGDGDCTIRGTKSEKTGRISASGGFKVPFKMAKKSAEKLSEDDVNQTVADAIEMMLGILHQLDEKGFDVSILLNSEPFKLATKSVKTAYHDLIKLACGENEDRLGKKYTITTVDQRVVRHFRPRIDAQSQSVFLANNNTKALEAGESE